MPALEYGAAIESIVACSPFGSLSSVVMSKKLMPGFGKSGTLRIICLRSIVNMKSFKPRRSRRSRRSQSSDRKPAKCSACLFVDDGDAIDAGPRWPAAQRLLHPGDRVLVALDERLDAAVEQVLHPPGCALARRRVMDEPAEPYALDTSTDHDPPRHTHVEKSRL